MFSNPSALESRRPLGCKTKLSYANRGGTETFGMNALALSLFYHDAAAARYGPCLLEQRFRQMRDARRFDGTECSRLLPILANAPKVDPVIVQKAGEQSSEFCWCQS